MQKPHVEAPPGQFIQSERFHIDVRRIDVKKSMMTHMRQMKMPDILPGKFQLVWRILLLDRHGIKMLMGLERGIDEMEICSEIMILYFQVTKVRRRLEGL
jgi:hypothetical protein